MNILITAGGTAEKIDEVRSIANGSAGNMGRALARAFSAVSEVENIFFVCGLSARDPESERTRITRVADTAELEAAIRTVCRRERIDAVVHAMAVSDYTPARVSTADGIADSVARLAPGASRDELRAAILSAPALPRDGKLPSDMDDPVLFLRRTPKIISMFRGLLPDATLVGFKLMNRAGRELLIDTAHRLLRANDCDFVLANDLSEISEARHTGRLVSPDGSYRTYSTKTEIAQGIAEAVLAARREKDARAMRRGGKGDTAT